MLSGAVGIVAVPQGSFRAVPGARACERIAGAGQAAQRPSPCLAGAPGARHDRNVPGRAGRLAAAHRAGCRTLRSSFAPHPLVSVRSGPWCNLQGLRRSRVMDARLPRRSRAAKPGRDLHEPGVVADEPSRRVVLCRNDIPAPARKSPHSGVCRGDNRSRRGARFFVLEGGRGCIGRLGTGH